MHKHIIYTVFFILYISVIIISSPALVQSLAPVENIADFFVTFLTGPFARSMAIIGLAVCGFMTMADKLSWRAALAVNRRYHPDLRRGGPPGDPPPPLFLRRRV